MNTAQRFEMSVTVNNNSPIQDYEMTQMDSNHSQFVL